MSKITSPPTRRAQQILDRLMAGKTYKEIGNELGIQTTSFGNYLMPLKRRYGCATTYELLIEYYKWRLDNEVREKLFRAVTARNEQCGDVTSFH